jgi:hypothetical protein
MRLLYWLSGAIILTLIFGTIYAAVQQNWRLGLNIDLAPMASTAIRDAGSGFSSTQIVGVPVENNDGPFLIMYDRNGSVDLSGLTINHQPPQLPASVLKNLQTGGETRITWQPQPGYRYATVIKKYDGGYVLAGRSLKDVETQEDKLAIVCVFAWLLAQLMLAATLVGTSSRVRRRLKA